MSGLFSQAASLIFKGVSAAVDMSRGWGSGIKWYGLEEGQEMAKKDGKPTMVIIHRQSCPACIRLKPLFADSEDVKRLSQRFIMVNVSESTDGRLSSSFSPDGGYVPRILFYDHKGQLMDDVTSDNNRYKYYYGSSDRAIRMIVKAMHNVADTIQPPAEGPRGPRSAARRPQRAGRWS